MRTYTNRLALTVSTVTLLCCVCPLIAEEALKPKDPQPTEATEATWLGRLREQADQFEEKYGTGVSLLLSYQGQLLLNGERREGKGKSSYSHLLEVSQRLWPGAKLFVTSDGGSGEGLNPIVGSVLDVNCDAGEPTCIYVSRLYLAQGLLDEKVTIAAGKMDLTDFFDASEVANDENIQFLSSSLVNNPTIPFPDFAIGAVVRAEPAEWFYAQAGVADAQAEGTETGLNTAFHDEDYFFNIYEVGFCPQIAERQGNCRFIFWYDPQAVDHIDGRGAERDDMGFALSFDQEVTDRVTLFLRYGFAHERVREIEHFWSLGGQLSAPLAGRDDDVLGVGVSQAIMGRDFQDANGAAATETLFETYYRIQVTDNIAISPLMQVIVNPGADNDAECAVTAGVRAVFSF